MNEKQIFTNILEEEIIDSKDISEEEKRKFLKKLFSLKDRKTNIMITGATGCGKSSTINALFKIEKAKVGVGVDPETMDITKYELDNLILWDSPGLGDGEKEDKEHYKKIIKKLNELDKDKRPLIDLVLVILDGSSKDLGTSYELIKVIEPTLGNDEKEKRILIAINQADMAMKGRYWNNEKNCPEEELKRFLDEKVTSIKNRIKDSTGLDVEPIYYSAGYTEADVKQNPYNLSKLLYYIMKSIPKDNMLSIIANTNKDENRWKYNEWEYYEENNEFFKFFNEFFEEFFQDTMFGKFVGAVGRVMDFFRGLF